MTCRSVPLKSWGDVTGTVSGRGRAGWVTCLGFQHAQTRVLPFSSDFLVLKSDNNLYVLYTPVWYFLSEYAKSDNLKSSKSFMWERYFRGVILARHSTELKRECFWSIPLFLETETLEWKQTLWETPNENHWKTKDKNLAPQKSRYYRLINVQWPHRWRWS